MIFDETNAEEMIRHFNRIVTAVDCGGGIELYAMRDRETRELQLFNRRMAAGILARYRYRFHVPSDGPLESFESDRAAFPIWAEHPDRAKVKLNVAAPEAIASMPFNGGRARRLRTSLAI